MKHTIITALAGMEGAGKKLLRVAVAVIFLWIGGLKFFNYEAAGIVPFVANSPFMSFFYNHPAGYKTHMNKEGELIAGNHSWYEQNNTYGFSKGLGIFLVILGFAPLMYTVTPVGSMIGTALIFLVTPGTLSFLATTPGSWFPALGDQDTGFPFLSGRGRLVLKDAALLGAALILLSDTAKYYLQRLQQHAP